jgi:crotonobetainyl-CoA:carnitine CoA-transferase CaiB-like acyl-CoA transferase
MRELLDTVTVLDFTQMLQGPWATQKLADMGATVWKIEPTGTGEGARNVVLAGSTIADENPSFYPLNRNKESVTVDITSERGQEICLDLAREANVVVHNFRPGVVDRCDLTYEDFTDIDPEIIYCGVSGYGSEGPYADADRPGQDLLVQALSGFASITGRREDPPTAAGTPIVDLYSGVLTAFAIALALFHRERTGEGQRVETSLLDAALDLQVQELNVAMNLDTDIERSEEGISNVLTPAPYGIYESADGHVAIGSFGWSGEGLGGLADVLDVPTLAEYNLEDLWSERDGIKRAIETGTRARPTDDLLETLRDAGLWCAPVRDYDEVLADPQLEVNDMLETFDHPEAGEVRTLGVPVRFSETSGGIERPSPTLGQHTEAVLKQVGYTKDEIDDLQAADVV